MPPTLAALLVQKEEIDSSDTASAMRSYERWIADALEALLRTISPGSERR